MGWTGRWRWRVESCEARFCSSYLSGEKHGPPAVSRSCGAWLTPPIASYAGVTSQHTAVQEFKDVFNTALRGELFTQWKICICPPSEALEQPPHYRGCATPPFDIFCFPNNPSSIKHLFQTFRLAFNSKAEMVVLAIDEPIAMRRNESTNITEPSASSLFDSGLAPRVTH